jgi:Fic family protein
LDHFFYKLIHLNYWSEIPRPPLKALVRMFDAGPEGFLGGLSAKNYISIAGTTTPTATRDLGDLVAKGALKRTGERKTTRYWLNL